MALLLTQLALPTLMRERGRSGRAHAVLVTATVAIAGVAGAVALVVIAWPTWVATTVLGQDERAVDVTTLRLLAAAWAAMSVVPLLTYFHIDRHRRVAFTPFAGAVVLVVVTLGVDTAPGLAAVTLVVFAACAVTLGLPAVQRVAPLTRAVPWSGATSAARSTPADIAMVVPFYNPGPDALVDTVRRLASTLDEVGTSYRVVAVSDGSTDGSAAALAAQAHRPRRGDRPADQRRQGRRAARRSRRARRPGRRRRSSATSTPTATSRREQVAELVAHRRRQRGRRGGGQQAAPGLGARRAAATAR